MLPVDISWDHFAPSGPVASMRKMSLMRDGYHVGPKKMSFMQKFLLRQERSVNGPVGVFEFEALQWNRKGLAACGRGTVVARTVVGRDRFCGHKLAPSDDSCVQRGAASLEYSKAKRSGIVFEQK